MNVSPEKLKLAVAEAWPKAQALWSRFLLLSQPVDQAEQASVAQINLATRQVSLHHKLILGKGLVDCVEALLAHEVGHHVRYPGTLAVEARLRLLERSLVPIKGYSLINLFTDLLINEIVGQTMREQLVRIYQAFTADIVWERDPAFLFYLSVYEELWSLEPGTLLGPHRDAFERWIGKAGCAYAGYRADAQMLAQNLWTLGPNLFTQFLYFVSVVSRYIRPQMGEAPDGQDPYSCGRGEPSPDDWADALTPSAREQAAIERALREGWLREEQGKRMKDAQALERRIRGLPGVDSADETMVPEVMAAYYRREAHRYLLRPPPVKMLGEAVVPTTLDEWEPGDPLRDVDWLATLIERGPLYGAAQPLKRVRIAEVEGYDVPLWQPRVEIYLDVSGSMPDPRRTRNAMTLAAQILNSGAIRAGGWARAVLYSGATVTYWEWCRSEIELSRFLMHFIGGGTVFPFELLEKSLHECGSTQPVRVLITDTDFDSNYGAKPEHQRIFADAVRAAPVVMLLHCPRKPQVAHYRSVGARVVEVPKMEDFPRMAAGLAHALFDEEKHGDH
jgi:hypothetical protein